MKYNIFKSLISIGIAIVVAGACAQTPGSAPNFNNNKFSETQMIYLLKSCAPRAATNTMLAVATTESAYHPYAISLNSPVTLAKRFGRPNQTIQLQRQPESRDEALLWMRWLLQHNVTVSIGLLQVNSDNAVRFHIAPEDLLDPCTNIAVGSQLLAEAFASQKQFNPNDQAALLRALSVYNSGTASLGFYNGYVAQVLKNAKR
jgi:type IV secretion system protein VirB1